MSNYFCPQQKLISKVRDGAKVTKKYDAATTPHRRAMTHTAVGEQDKAILTDTYAELNPAAIQRQIQALTAQLLTLTTSKPQQPPNLVCSPPRRRNRPPPRRSTMPSRNTSVTDRCCVCAAALPPGRPRRNCSDACRQVAWRRRHQPALTPPALPTSRPRKPSTVYEWPDSEEPTARHPDLPRLPHLYAPPWPGRNLPRLRGTYYS